MNRAIAAKEQNHIATLARRGHAHSPFDALIKLERFQILRRTSQPENGSHPHARGESSRKIYVGTAVPL